MEFVELDHPLLSDQLLEKFKDESDFRNKTVILQALYAFLRPQVRQPPAANSEIAVEQVCRTINKLHTDALIVLAQAVDYSANPKLLVHNELREQIYNCLAAIFAHQPLPVTHEIDHDGAKDEKGSPVSVHQFALKLNVLAVLLTALKTKQIDLNHAAYRYPTSVQSAAMDALAGLSTDVEGKKALVRDGGIQALIDAVTSGVQQLTATDKKALTPDEVVNHTALLQHSLQVMLILSIDIYYK